MLLIDTDTPQRLHIFGEVVSASNFEYGPLCVAVSFDQLQHCAILDELVLSSMAQFFMRLTDRAVLPFPLLFLT